MAPSPVPVRTPSHRPRSNSAQSAQSGAPSFSSPLARRPRLGQISTTPQGSYQIQSTPGSARTPGVASSYRNSSYLQSPLESSHNVGSSSAASSAGSNVGGPPKGFRRGHVRKKGPVGVKAANPDEVDLMALEDPDEVFRLYSVRDVRGLETRASDAAAAKVSELRVMVGERYRDLLSAADSIVRMRGAADKLVHGLDRIDILLNGMTEHESIDATPIKGKGKSMPRLTPRRAGSPDSERTLADAATLSLTIHLLLSLPSIVHTLLDSSSFLQAARLEGVARVVHRELSSYSSGEDEDGESPLLDTFPIIEKQWESILNLGPAIVRRSITELQTWDVTPLATAETLAAIVLLENTSLPKSLSLLLDARSKSLSDILAHPAHKAGRKGHHEVKEVLDSLHKIIALILHSLDASLAIFGAEKDSQTESDGLLVKVLGEVESPTRAAGSAVDDTATPRLAPTLSSLPNYALLIRHLPSPIIDFTPFLHLTTAKGKLESSQAFSIIQTWFSKEGSRIVEGVTRWIADLHEGARDLARVREAVHTGLQNTGGHGQELQQKLDRAIEKRLEEVYNSLLSKLVNRVPACLSSLLTNLPTSRADVDPAFFTIEMALPFPPMSHYSLPVKSIQGRDPFDTFLDRVIKKVDGKSPLVERGLGELEAHARGLKEDLQIWLGQNNAEEDSQSSLMRSKYILNVRQTLDKVYEEMLAVLRRVAKDTDACLFLGNFVFLLSASESFVEDLFLRKIDHEDPEEIHMKKLWLERLAEFQAESLEGWLSESVGKAVQILEDSMSISFNTSQASKGLPTTNGSRSESQWIPSNPSATLLSAIHSLATAVRRVGFNRVHHNSSIVEELMNAFAKRYLLMIEDFVRQLSSANDPKDPKMARQTLWDITFLQHFWIGGPRKEWSTQQESLVQMFGWGDQGTDLKQRIEESSLQYLQRSQLLFAPLILSHQRARNLLKSVSTSASLLLPLGAPTLDHELRNAVGLTKPGPRLGLLPTRS